MGLLDDAIREHLDLKRRRGADPTDVARMEQEALGPVRREPAPAEATDHPDEPAAAEPAPEREDQSAPHEQQQDPRHSDIVHQPTTEFRVEDHHDDEDEGPAEPRPAPPADRDEDGPRAGGDAEDVLEETPDFLQETPEHDRLWFEQRPPRDFDFDG